MRRRLNPQRLFCCRYERHGYAICIDTLEPQIKLAKTLCEMAGTQKVGVGIAAGAQRPKEGRVEVVSVSVQIVSVARKGLPYV